MSQNMKKDSADEIIQRSIELFGLTPKEISDKNVEWMRKKGFKKPKSYNYEPQDSQISKSVPKYSRLSKLLKRLGIK